MATELFGAYRKQLDSPYETGFQIVPHATNDLAFKPRALYSHDGGNVNVVFDDGRTRVFKFAAGEIKTLRPAKVLVLLTTSTDIEGLL